MTAELDKARTHLQNYMAPAKIDAIEALARTIAREEIARASAGGGEAQPETHPHGGNMPPYRYQEEPLPTVPSSPAQGTTEREEPKPGSLKHSVMGEIAIAASLRRDLLDYRLIEAIADRLDATGLLAVDTTAHARIAELERERDEALRYKDNWFRTHDAHRRANQTLGQANGELFKRAYEAEADLARLRSAVESARDDLQKYARHGPSCECTICFAARKLTVALSPHMGNK
jgi:hypothetical protein